MKKNKITMKFKKFADAANVGVMVATFWDELDEDTQERIRRIVDELLADLSARFESLERVSEVREIDGKRYFLECTVLYYPRVGVCKLARHVLSDNLFMRGLGLMSIDSYIETAHLVDDLEQAGMLMDQAVAGWEANPRLNLRTLEMDF